MFSLLWLKQVLLLYFVVRKKINETQILFFLYISIHHHFLHSYMFLVMIFHKDFQYFTSECMLFYHHNLLITNFENSFLCFNFIYIQLYRKVTVLLN